ncbi:Uncharacterized protein APZ42_019093 [Daphnia magna]|uniref:Uncharacterized protein n=1 Tax=Daphnia magna TaxID=35525 RepID=A0A0P5Y537_9CRUS|nr:Uncharacterized protein APZ42_019093 [Daphnia magna]
MCLHLLIPNRPHQLPNIRLNPLHQLTKLLLLHQSSLAIPIRLLPIHTQILPLSLIRMVPKLKVKYELVDEHVTYTKSFTENKASQLKYH